MFGHIILRNIPKQEARLDLSIYPLKGGFRGFGQVPPHSRHYVGVKDGQSQVGFWCRLEPRGVVVKKFTPDGFVDAPPETAAQFTQLARSGAMGTALTGYSLQQFGQWRTLVDHLDRVPPESFSPTLHPPEEGPGSRFDKLWQQTHNRDKDSLLAELQFSFVSWLVTADTDDEDEAAFGRWRHLVLAAYNAGERTIAAAEDTFAHLVDVLMAQYDLLPDEWLQGDSFLVSSQAGYMSEDMIDTGDPTLEEKGREFSRYLQTRAA